MLVYIRNSEQNYNYDAIFKEEQQKNRISLIFYRYAIIFLYRLN